MAGKGNLGNGVLIIGFLLFVDSLIGFGNLFGGSGVAILLNSFEFVFSLILIVLGVKIRQMKV
jgi:hypothetical protein